MWKDGQKLVRERDRLAPLVANPDPNADPQDVQDDRDALQQIHQQLAPIMTHLDPSQPHYIPEDMAMNLSAENQSYITYYKYVTTDIHRNDIEKVFAKAHPIPPAPANMEEVGRIEYIGKLLGKSDNWPFCPAFGRGRGRRAKSCKAPNLYRLCDSAMIYNVDPTSVVGGHAWKIPLFLIEIKGTAESPDGQHYGFQQVCNHACNQMVYLPQAYGMVVRQQDLSMYEFKRNHVLSKIECFERKYIFNGTSSSIGNEFNAIVDAMTKCILKSLVRYLKVCHPGYDDLNTMRYHPSPAGQEAPESVCTPECWNLPSLADLDAHIANMPVI